MGEGDTGRLLDSNQTFALALASHLQDAVMTERVVPRLAEQRKRRPGAAGAAHVGVVAAATISPEIVDGAIAHVAQRRRALPDVSQRGVPDVAAGPRLRLQRWA